MTSLKICACVIILISIGNSTGELICGPNESVDKCPRNCSYEYCPTNEHQDKIPCSKPHPCPPPACTCNFNFRRDKNGTCIPTQNCPPFECSGINEIFDPCPSYCPGEDCSNANPTGECPFLSLLVVNCSPACRCIPYFWKNEGICVPFLECPGVKEELQKYGNKQPEIINYYIK